MTVAEASHIFKHIPNQDAELMNDQLHTILSIKDKGPAVILSTEEPEEEEFDDEEE